MTGYRGKCWFRCGNAENYDVRSGVVRCKETRQRFGSKSLHALKLLREAQMVRLAFGRLVLEGEGGKNHLEEQMVR